MKKLTALSLFIFWALVAALLTSGLAFYQNNRQASTPIEAGQTQAGGTTPTQILSMQEIAKHNSVSSCWLLIDGKVYDVTSYVYQHPGNAETIIPTCGTDATQAYNTKGRASRPSPHSQNAHELLKQFYIGDFGQTPVVPAPGTTSPSTPTTSAVQPNPTAQTTPTTNATITLSSQEVAKHNTTSNCWMIINGNVYNVTSYIGNHPGGVSAILRACGKDGTALFEGLPHSTNAHQLLANFYVGVLGQKATAQTIQKTAAPAIPAGTREVDTEND